MKKAFTLVIILLIFSCHQQADVSGNDDKPSALKPSSHPISIKVAIAKDSIFIKPVVSNGRIRSRHTARLHFRQSGYLDRVFVHNGQVVSRGTVIARLENDLQRNAVKQAQVRVAKARQKAEELRISYSSADSATLQIRSGLAEALAGLREARIRYEQTLLRAPFTGQIADLRLQAGNLVHPSDTIATLIDNRHLTVRFPVTEADLPYLHKGMQADIRNYYDPSLHGRAVITDINPSVDDAGMVRVEASLTGSHPHFLHGMRVKVHILRPVKNLILIPKSALVLRQNKEVVFTYRQGLAIWHYVRLAGENDRYYAVREGLKAGDTVIVSNNMNLAHEARVNIDP